MTNGKLRLTVLMHSHQMLLVPIYFYIEKIVLWVSYGYVKSFSIFTVFVQKISGPASL